MAEYKDVAAIKTKIQKICDNCWHPYRLGGCPEHCGINDAVKAIDSAPTVDAVPVIRCGKCNFWDRDHISCEGLAKCCTGEGGIRYRNRSDFCSRGERKDGGDG